MEERMDFFADGILGETDHVSAEAGESVNEMLTTSADENADAEQSSEELTFESAMERLEAIVKEMESGRVTLDQSLDLFKEGSELAQFCQKKLSDNENKIKQLLETSEGPHEEDFHA